MSSESVSAQHSDFCDVALRLRLLNAEDASRLQTESRRQELPPSQVALRLGLLDAVAIDAIETLQRPTEAVPGYEILDLRGRGGMGVVYRARQSNLGRLVALKTVLVSRMSDTNALARFEQEARTLAQLRHPNIVSIYDFGRAAGRLYFAMEFIDGTDVDALVQKEGPLSEYAAWGIARQVAAGLAHGDAHGIVHRDIKPANLLLVDPPEGFPLPAGVPLVKIADFGLALLVTDRDSQTRLTKDNATVGSPHYMAPEQLEGSTVNRRADMYALGASVYEMLSGQAPFVGLSLPQIIGHKLTGAPRPIDATRHNLSAASRTLVARLMVRDPEARPANYSDLLREIDEVLSQVNGTTKVAARFDASAATAIISRDVETKASLPQTQAAIPTVQPRRGRRGWWLAGSACVLLAMFAVFLFHRPPAATPLERAPVVEVGDSQYLFNGSSLFGWTTVRGQWSVPPGDAVIAGTNGLLGRSLPPSQLANDRLPQHYRLLMAVQLNEASTAAVHFGASFEQQKNGTVVNGPDYAVRMTPDAVTLGSVPEHGEFQPLLPPTAMPIGVKELHAVMIERLPTSWFISIDGVDVGALPLHEKEYPQIELSVTGGTAWFSDIELIELQPKPQP